MGRDKSFRGGIVLSQHRAKHNSLPSLGAVRRDGKVERRPKMYTGTLIDELIATVERTEARNDRRPLRLLDNRSQEEKLAYWYAVAQQEVAQLDSSLAGVA